MADNRQVSVLDIQVDASQAIQSMNAYQQQIELLKKENEELEESVKQGNKTQLEADEIYTKNAEKIKILNQRIAAQRKAVQNQIKAHEDNGKSMVALRAELSNLTAEFDNLSKAEREGAKGKELQEKIKAVTKEIKNAEFATDRYYRNVGNYTNSIIDAFGQMGDAASGLGLAGGGALKNIMTGFKGLDTTMKVVFANPLIALIGVLAGILMAVANAISKNEEYVNRLRVAMAPLNMVMDAFANILSKAADVLVSVIETLTSGAAAILDFVGATNGASAAVADYNKQIKEEIELEQRRRDTMVKNSEDELKIAKMKNALAKTDKKNFKSRREQLQAIVKLEEGIAARNLEDAEKALKTAQDKAARGDNTAADNDELARLEEARNKAETDYYNKVTAINAKITELDNQEIESKKATAKAAEEAAKKKAEAKRKELEAAKKAADEAAKQRQKEIDDAKAAEIKRFQQELSAQKTANDAELAEQDRQQRLRIVKLQEDGATQDQIEAEQAKMRSERLGLEAAQLQSMYDEMQQGRYESDLDYAQRKAELESRMAENEVQTAELAAEQYLEVQKKKAEADKAIEQAKTEAKAALQKGYDAMMQTSLGKTKAGVATQKILATAQVAMNAGKAISEAVASASVGDPYTIALRIAAAVASVTAAIAKAKDAISSAHFATGGYVSGPGNAVNDRSDRIPAMLSNGEFVVNSTATASNRALLEAINAQNGNNAGMSVNANQSLIQQLTSAISAMPAPVVSVEEINRVSNNVKAIENSASF